MKKLAFRLLAAALTVSVAAGAAPVSAKTGIFDPEPDGGNLALGARVTVSSVYGNADDYSGIKLTDGKYNHDGRWAAADEEVSCAVIDLRRVSTVSRVRIYEDTLHGQRIGSHTIEYWDGEGWRTAAEGEQNPEEYTDSENRNYRVFDTAFQGSVDTNMIKITFLSQTTSGPAVREIEILNQSGGDVTAGEIRLNGILLDGFDPARFSYDVVLPPGSGAPEVTSDTGTVVNSDSVNGTATVTVTSGQLSNVYSINFTEDKGHMVNEIIHAHKFSEKDRVTQDELASDKNSVGNFQAGGYLCYKDIDFAGGEAKVLMAVASCTGDGLLEIRIDSPDGQLIGSLGINSTGSARVFSEHYARLEEVSGVHDLYITAKNELAAHLDTLVISSYDGSETQAEKDSRMSWWREARYGQFIHLGAYANFPFKEEDNFQGYSEWIMFNRQITRTQYEQDCVTTFNPKDFSAEKIVGDAKDAGVKYMVFTSKHHEGYSMYDTDIGGFRNFSLMKYGVYDGEDPILSLSEECEKAGIRFGCYYSIMDWRHWAQNTLGESCNDKAAYVSEMKAQLRELIEKYDVEMLWFDGEWHDWWTTADGDALYRYLRTLKPSLIINNRVGKRAATDGDFGTPEQEIPAGGLDYDWESCITMNNSWGYMEFDTNWKSTEWIIRSLVDTASKGGNMLLNVGPDQNGVVPEECTRRLAEAGKWLDKYGDSIYGTTASPFGASLSFGAATKKDGKLYLHVTSLPEDGRLLVPAIANEINAVRIMGGAALPYYSGEGYLLIQIPEETGFEYDLVIEVDTNGIPAEAENSYLSKNLALGKSAEASSVYFNDPQYAGDKAVDGNGATRWASADGITATTLEIDFGTETEFNTVIMSECTSWGARIADYTIDYFDGTSWVTAAVCNGMGPAKSVSFDPVKSSKMRINIIGLTADATGGPTISEIQVYMIGADIPVVLRGDMDGNGTLNVSDVVSLRTVVMNGNADSEQLLAGDMDGNGVLNVNDVVALRKGIMKQQ